MKTRIILRESIMFLKYMRTIKLLFYIMYVHYIIIVNY